MVSAQPTLQGIFVAGTGTDVGKTLVTAALSRALWQENIKHIPIKPVQTGIIDVSQADATLYTAAQMGLDVPEAFCGRTLYSFAMAASPHLAARAEGQELSVKQIITSLQGINSAHPVLLEGAGGLYVPLNATESMLDVMMALSLPVVLVMRNTLGALNHTMLSIEALRQRGLTLAAVICKEVSEDAQEQAIRADNILYLQEYLQKSSVQVLTVPYLPCLDEAAFDSMAENLRPLARQCKQLWAQNNALQDVLKFDKEHLWHPYTSALNPLPVYEVTHAKGTRIYLRNGRELIDGMSSWWCAVHGYGHEDLVRAAQEQAGRMSHVMFGGITHAPAVTAAQKLMQLLPEPARQVLTRLFWADSGSVAVEVALKMALQYQQGRGEAKRTKILSPRGGYYGDTLGAMSVCDPINGMHSLFAHVVPQHIFIPKPACAFDGGAQCSFDADSLRPLEEAFALHGESLAACIIEPIVQGAGGMYFYHPKYLERLHALCRAHNVLLIFDEIATGFGRTGKMFAHEWCADFGAPLSPDILCLGKALTGGMLTLAATLCSEQVAEGICQQGNVFMHGPTFMANPLACAVAAASLDLLAQNTWQAQVARIETELTQWLSPCMHCESVREVRVLGAIGVVEMREAVDMASLQAFFVQRGVWIRPFGKLIYLMPPYVSSSEDINALCEAVYAAVCGEEG